MGSVTDHMMAALPGSGSRADREQSLWADGGPRIPQPNKQSVIYLGDSLTFSGGLIAPDTDKIGTGFAPWAQFHSKDRLLWLYNAGIGGDTLAMIEDRLLVDVLNRQPGVCVILAGINDIKGAPATDITVMQASMTRMLNLLQAAGVFVILCTIPPSNLVDLTSEKTQLYRWNQWIVQQGQMRRGMVACEVYTAVADPAGVGFLAGYSTDGTHPNSKGASAIGRRIADVINQLFPLINGMTLGSGDPDELNTNAMMTGNVAGVATGVSTIGGVLTKVARTDSLGEWQRWTISAAATNTLLMDITAGFVAGEKVYATFEVAAQTWSGVSTSFFAVEFRNAVNAILSTKQQMNDISHTDQPNPNSGILRTNEYTIPATTTRIRLFHRILTTTADPVTVDYGRMSLRKVGT